MFQNDVVAVSTEGSGWPCEASIVHDGPQPNSWSSHVTTQTKTSRIPPWGDTIGTTSNTSWKHWRTSGGRSSLTSWDKVKNGDVYRPIQPFTDVWRDFLQIKSNITLVVEETSYYSFWVLSKKRHIDRVFHPMYWHVVFWFITATSRNWISHVLKRRSLWSWYWTHSARSLATFCSFINDMFLRTSLCLSHIRFGSRFQNVCSRHTQHTYQKDLLAAFSATHAWRTIVLTLFLSTALRDVVDICPVVECVHIR
jgi:hypothetical protein